MINKIESIVDTVERFVPQVKHDYSHAFYHYLLTKILKRLVYGQIIIIEGEKKYIFGDDDTLKVTVVIKHSAFYKSVVLNGSTGAAESYMRCEWTTDNLVNLVRLMVRNRKVLMQIDHGFSRIFSITNKWRHKLSDNSLKGSKKNIIAHYDLSNDFYKLFLDETMTYSSGVFPYVGATLAEASLEKLDRICRKLQLSESDHILEIGSGWGSFAIHAASNYGCKVTTTTISDQQFIFAQQAIIDANVNDKVTLLNQDYRNLQGQYDKIVSIEMIEAVGHQYVPLFLKKCMDLLKPEGTMALQAITISDQLYDEYLSSVDFIQQYVFPGACLLSLSNMFAKLKSDTDFRMIHLEDITSHYAHTLSLWRKRFLDKWEEAQKLGFSDKFLLLWEYYLAYCEGGFLERQINSIQCILARSNYKSSIIINDRIKSSHD